MKLIGFAHNDKSYIGKIRTSLQKKDDESFSFKKRAISVMLQERFVPLGPVRIVYATLVLDFLHVLQKKNIRVIFF